ncbi:MAG TPA: hypothetical protein DCR35_21440, partial [Runella sp.]|nr:hypothetical protein [Runella sp.]
IKRLLAQLFQQKAGSLGIGSTRRSRALSKKGRVVSNPPHGHLPESSETFGKVGICHLDEGEV